MIVDNQQEKPPVLSLPNIPSLSEEIRLVCKEYNHDCFQIWEYSEIVAFQRERQIAYRDEFFSNVHYPKQWWNIYWGNVQKIETELVNIKMHSENVMKKFLPLLSMYEKSTILSIGMKRRY